MEHAILYVNDIAHHHKIHKQWSLTRLPLPLFPYSGPDPETCAQNCALDAGDYEGTYGISTQGNSLKLQYVVPESDGMTDVGSRTYLMQDDSNYQVSTACWAFLHPRNAWFSLNSSPCPTHAHLQTDVPPAQPGVHL